MAGIRVTFNTGYRAASEAIADASAEMALRQRQVASGRRLHAPSDDPAAAAAAVTERTELAITEQYRQATDTVTSRLTVLDTVLSQLIDETTAAKVAVQSGRGSVPAPQRAAAADQILAIRDSMFCTANTQYRGVFVLSGSDSTRAPYTKTAAGVSGYQGTHAPIEVDIDRQTTVDVALDGDTVMRGSDTDDLFTVLESLAAAVRSGDEAALNAGSAALDRAFERMNRALSRVGADTAQVDLQKSQLESRRLASSGRVAALENVDLAEAISAMQQSETAYRAALGAVGQGTRVSLMDYLT